MSLPLNVKPLANYLRYLHTISYKFEFWQYVYWWACRLNLVHRTFLAISMPIFIVFSFTLMLNISSIEFNTLVLYKAKLRFIFWFIRFTPSHCNFANICSISTYIITFESQSRPDRDRWSGKLKQGRNRHIISHSFTPKSNLKSITGKLKMNWRCVMYDGNGRPMRF